MSYESNREALRVFSELDAMDITERLDTLRDASYEGYHVPASAALTARVFRHMGIERDAWSILWTKLVGRPVARVYKLVTAVEERGPEEATDLVRRFGAQVPMLDGATRDFPEGAFEEVIEDRR